MQKNEVSEELRQTNKEEEQINKKRNMMLSESVEKLVCNMAVPTIISMLVTAFYNLVDTYFVGQLNSNAATGAVGLVFSLMSIIQAIGYFFGHGSGNYISRAIGKKEYDKAAKMASTGFFSSLFVGCVFSIVGLTFRVPLSYLLGSTDIMLADTVAYLTYILIGTPFMMAAFVLNNQLRLQGNSIFSMLGLVSGAIGNIILDPLLIFDFNMGVSGAALATIISQFVSFIVLLIGCQKSSNVSIRWKNFTPARAYYVEIFGGGLPSFGTQGLASVANLLLNRIAGGYGDAAIAAFSVVTRITNISAAVILGFGQGFQPVCGFNYGAGKFDRVKEAFWFSIKVSTIFLLIIGVGVYVFAPEAVAFFRNDKTVVEIGSKALRYQCMVLPLLGWVIVLNMFLQNIQKTIRASILAMARQGLIFLPVLYVLSAAMGLTGLELSQPVSDLLTFALSVPFGVSVLKELKEKTVENI